MKFFAKGFTLVELLVVISIAAVIGVYTLANFNSFGEDQKLKNAALDVQSFLRLAQTNATSGVTCQTGGAPEGWLVVYNASALELKCRNLSGDSNVKTFSFASRDITIDNIKAGVNDCAGKEFVFSYPLGSMTSNCGHKPVEITLKNSKNNSTRKIILEQGGRIYVQ